MPTEFNKGSHALRLKFSFKKAMEDISGLLHLFIRGSSSHLKLRKYQTAAIKVKIYLWRTLTGLHVRIWKAHGTFNLV